MPPSELPDRLSTKERAELEMLRDVAKRLIGFDGGAEVMAWVDAHRLHKKEPYIGCPFCRDRFVARARVEHALSEVSSHHDISTPALVFIQRALDEEEANRG